MTDESTLPMQPFIPQPAAGIGPGLADAPAAPPGGVETVLDTSQRLDMEVDAKTDDGGRRGRARERGTSHRLPPRTNAPSDIRLLQDANSAAAALAAALEPSHNTALSAHRVAVPEEGEHSLDSVHHLQGASPEKKPRIGSSKIPPHNAPHFGGRRGEGYPPLFHGAPSSVVVTGLGDPKHGEAVRGAPTDPGPNPPPDPTGPQRFDLDEPTWVGSLRVQLQQLVQTQVGMQTQLEDSGRSLRNLQSEIRQLGSGQEALMRRADDQDQAMQQMRNEVRELERELNALKSAPPTRSVSPAPHRPAPPTPRSDYGGRNQQEVDEMQIVIGGWNECKRDQIEQDVRHIFASMNGEAIKELKFTSTAPGQVRAVLSTYELCVKHVGHSVTDRDWRGREYQLFIANPALSHRTLCGKWIVSPDSLWEQIQGLRKRVQAIVGLLPTSELAQREDSPKAPMSNAVEVLTKPHEIFSTFTIVNTEVFAALKGARTGVSAGLDGVTYEGVRHLLSQALDGILAAQSTLQLLRHSCGAAYAAKIDIKAAFDSLSQGAVFRWLMNCAPASECERLFQLLHGTSVELSLGGSQHVVHMQQGLMQGTAYSADVFSRVLDYFLGPLHERFCAQFGRAETAALSLPHFIVYADDIVLFSDTPSGLQCKLQQIVDVLATL
ncbi:pol, partial [Symbiodinium microadriaticum]